MFADKQRAVRARGRLIGLDKSVALAIGSHGLQLQIVDSLVVASNGSTSFLFPLISALLITIHVSLAFDIFEGTVSIIRSIATGLWPFGYSGHLEIVLIDGKAHTHTFTHVNWSASSIGLPLGPVKNRGVIIESIRSGSEDRMAAFVVKRQFTSHPCLTLIDPKPLSANGAGTKSDVFSTRDDAEWIRTTDK